jgi:hypothetical protein
VSLLSFGGGCIPCSADMRAAFNIGRPRPILDVHARGMYSLNTFVILCFAGCMVVRVHCQSTCNTLWSDVEYFPIVWCAVYIHFAACTTCKAQYDRTSSQPSVDEARKQKGRTINGLPPTGAAFVVHINKQVTAWPR